LKKRESPLSVIVGGEAVAEGGKGGADRVTGTARSTGGGGGRGGAGEGGGEEGEKGKFEEFDESETDLSSDSEGEGSPRKFAEKMKNKDKLPKPIQ
jgi:hypothetical protein